MTSDFAGVSPSTCATAWRLIQPSVDAAAADGTISRRAGCMVVLAPAPTPVDPLFVGVVSDGPDPELYLLHALAKAHVSQVTGLSSRAVQQDSPHLYHPGMTKWGGSVVRRGLVCAFSGVQPEFDEMFAGWMADAVIALCRHAMTRPDGVMDSSESFLAGPPFETKPPGCRRGGPVPRVTLRC